MTVGSRYLATLLLASLLASPLDAQTLYKYRGEDGAWVYSDRVPPPDVSSEARDLPQGERGGSVSVSERLVDAELQIFATNDTHAPVQLGLLIDALFDVATIPDEDTEDWVVPAQSEMTILSLAVNPAPSAPGIRYRYRWLPGDPRAAHRPELPYRAPYALSARYPVTQAWPDSITHRTPDSRYAVDIAMPIGTGVYAARGGIVVDAEGNFFRSGPVDEANLIRILHDDGTFGVYAHLNRSTIRVRAGDRVERGQYIADSGNTGFSSGPHLHFAVLRNAGFQFESVPVQFAGAGGQVVTPASGSDLVAH